MSKRRYSGVEETRQQLPSLLEGAHAGQAVIITKRGKPVAKLVPVDPPSPKSVFGCMVDQMEIVGDLEKPAWTWLGLVVPR